MSIARDLLKALVDALNRTNWSSWQTTAEFWPALEAARSGLDEPETAGDVRRHVICVCPDCARDSGRAARRKFEALRDHLQQRVKEHEDGACMSIAESVHGAATFLEVLRKMSELDEKEQA